MAFGCWLKGYCDKVEYFSKFTKPNWDIVGGRRVDRRELGKYLTPAFYKTLRLWKNVKEYGWPDGKGWGKQPAPLLVLVTTWNGLYNEWQESQRSN